MLLCGQLCADADKEVMHITAPITAAQAMGVVFNFMRVSFGALMGYR
jgi:hypothetical protein